MKGNIISKEAQYMLETESAFKEFYQPLEAFELATLTHLPFENDIIWIKAKQNVKAILSTTNYETIVHKLKRAFINQCYYDLGTVKAQPQLTGEYWALQDHLCVGVVYATCVIFKIIKKFNMHDISDDFITAYYEEFSAYFDVYRNKRYISLNGINEILDKGQVINDYDYTKKDIKYLDYANKKLKELGKEYKESAKYRDPTIYQLVKEVDELKSGWKREEDGFKCDNVNKKINVLHKLLNLSTSVVGKEREEFMILCAFMTGASTSTLEQRLSTGSLLKMMKDREKLFEQFPILSK